MDPPQLRARDAGRARPSKWRRLGVGPFLAVHAGVAARLSELDSAEDMVVMCKSGSRSARALELLVSAGFRKVKNLKGGMNAWAREVDPSQPVY